MIYFTSPGSFPIAGRSQQRTPSVAAWFLGSCFKSVAIWSKRTLRTARRAVAWPPLAIDRNILVWRSGKAGSEGRFGCGQHSVQFSFLTGCRTVGPFNWSRTWDHCKGDSFHHGIECHQRYASGILSARVAYSFFLQIGGKARSRARPRSSLFGRTGACVAEERDMAFG